MVRPALDQFQECRFPGKILVVDDDPSTRRMLTRTLIVAGFSVEESDSGDDAISRHQVNPPDLVVLDMMMPGLDGLETCRRMRTQFGEDCAPIIFHRCASGF